MKHATKLFSVLAMAAVALLLAGCAQNPEPILRQRAQAYTQLLVDDKFDEAVNYYDPDLVAKRGRTAVTGSFKAVVGIVKGLTALGGRKPAGFELRKLDFDSTKTRATLQVVYLTTDNKGADRKESPSDQKWVLKNNTWFATE